MFCIYDAAHNINLQNISRAYSYILYKNRIVINLLKKAETTQKSQEIDYLSLSVLPTIHARKNLVCAECLMIRVYSAHICECPDTAAAAAHHQSKYCVMHSVPKSTYAAHKTYKLPKINIKCMQANNKNRLSIMNGRQVNERARALARIFSRYFIALHTHT